MKISKVELKEIVSGITKDSKAFKSLKKKDLIKYNRSGKTWELNRSGKDLFTETIPENTRKGIFCENPGFGWVVDPEFRDSVYSKRRDRSKNKPARQVETTRQRLTRKKTVYVADLVDSFFKKDEYVTVLLNQTESNIEIIEGLDWDGYAKSCKYPMKTYDITADVAAGTRTPDVVEIDGIYNFAQHGIDTIEGVKVFEMDWIKKGRGYDLTILHGWIATTDSLSYHSIKSKEDAVKGLNRKITIRNRKEKPITMDTILTLAKYKKLTGACHDGCLEFMAKYNLPLGTKIKVKDLLPILKGEYGYNKIVSSIAD